MYDNKLPNIKLSEICWEYLEILKDVSYANAYTFFWSDQLELVQEGIRRIIPDLKGDWFRFKFHDKIVTFSISDEAIRGYKPKIQEFSSFGTVVKMLGAYENYVRKIAAISNIEIPDKIEDFITVHKIKPEDLNKKVMLHNFGRGIVFFIEIFGYNPHPSYIPSLQFFFEYRNVAVHNSGIVDERLLKAANNEYININGELKIGDIIYWNLDLCLQLNHLIISILSELDPHVQSILKLPLIEKKAYWYHE